MTALHLQAEIQQLLRKEKNITVLEAIRMLLRREEPQAGDDLTEEEVTELDAQRADRISGNVKFVNEAEAIRTMAELEELDAQEAARLRGDTKLYSREGSLRMMREAKQ